MEIWGPRRATSLREARSRTAFVHILRLLFTIGTVLSAGILLGTVLDHTLRPHTPQATASSLTVTVVGPRFEGRDSHDKPYVLTADTAQRRRENTNLVDLVNPHLQDSTSKAVQARTGVWHADTEVLDLVGDVVMTDAAGYTFTSDKTRMYVKENRVEGETPLHGIGPMGEAKADTYEVLDDGNRLVLKGNVWTKFESRKRPGATGAVKSR